MAECGLEGEPGPEPGPELARRLLFVALLVSAVYAVVWGGVWLFAWRKNGIFAGLGLGLGASWASVSYLARGLKAGGVGLGGAGWLVFNLGVFAAAGAGAFTFGEGALAACLSSMVAPQVISVVTALVGHRSLS